MLLIGAIGLGVSCFVGANYFLRSYLMNAEKRIAGNYATKKVIVAAVELPAGSVLSSANLAVRAIPARYLASTVLDPDSFSLADGQKIVVALKSGDPIDRGSLERTDRAALSATVASGERAITFPVDEISSLSGMLVPGDMIDLLYTGPGRTANSYRQPGEAGGSPKDLLHVRPILQAVTVMATGKTTQKRLVRVEGGGQQEVNMDFTTVTLKVSPAQAEQVLIAQKLGQLTAILRNPDDQSKVAALVLDETSFKLVDAAPPRGSRGNYLEMIIGGTGAAGGMRAQTEIGKTLALPVPAKPPAAAPPNALDIRDRLGITPSAPPTQPISKNG